MTEHLIQLNDLLVPTSHERSELFECPHVVILIDATTDRVFIMSTVKNQKPVQFGYQEIIRALNEGAIVKGIFEMPDYMKKSDRFINPHQLELRDQKFEVIKPIVKNLDQFLLPSYGENLIAECVKVADKKNINVNRTQIYEWLYRFFRAGCNINAFLRKPGTGKTKRTYAKKTGPKRADGVVGRMRSPTDEANIICIVNKHIKCRSPMSYPKAFSMYEDRFGSTPKVSPITGEIVGYEKFPAEQRLTEEQFTNYATAYVNKHIDAIRAAQGKTDEHRKNSKGLTGNIEEFYAEGPGHVYQIDETPLDIELVDEFDETRQRRMGKPTCYSVIDMFSRVWVAILLTFAKASAHTAREVIFVAFRNKEQFCAEIGVTLSEPWNISGKCRMIFVDNGEFKSELERAISKDAQIEQIYNTEGNSQQKGLVERKHRSLEDFLYGMVPGVGRKTIAEYLKRRLRHDALLNKRELYQILIDFVTRYNNYYPIDGLPLTKQMRIDGVKPIAMSKFEWGLKNRPGFLKPVDETELYLSLLEVGEVTIYRDHLFLPGKYINRKGKTNSTQGLQYTCEWTQQNGIQDYDKRRRDMRLPCRFMRYSLHTIFIETPEGLKPAKLKSIDALYEHMSDEDIAYDKKLSAVQTTQLKTVHDEKQSETRAAARNAMDKAKQEQVAINVNQANTQDISANRADAIAKEIDAAKKQFDQMTGTSASEAVAAAATETPELADQPSTNIETASPEVSDASQINVNVTTAQSTAALFAAKRAERKRQRSTE